MFKPEELREGDVYRFDTQARFEVFYADAVGVLAGTVGAIGRQWNRPSDYEAIQYVERDGKQIYPAPEPIAQKWKVGDLVIDEGGEVARVEETDGPAAYLRCPMCEDLWGCNSKTLVPYEPPMAELAACLRAVFDQFIVIPKSEKA